MSKDGVVILLSSFLKQCLFGRVGKLTEVAGPLCNTQWRIMQERGTHLDPTLPSQIYWETTKTPRPTLNYWSPTFPCRLYGQRVFYTVLMSS